MSLNITKHSEDFSTCSQIVESDIPEIAALGFKTVINNRPDNEGGPDQPASSQLEAAARKAGLHYIHIPVIPGNITPQNIADCIKFTKAAPAPILGFCRTGLRAGNLYQQAKNHVAG